MSATLAPSREMKQLIHLTVLLTVKILGSHSNVGFGKIVTEAVTSPKFIA
jgi:hypothetical protein